MKMLIITVISSLMLLASTASAGKHKGLSCGDIICVDDYDPQCGSDGVTYTNLCILQASQCDKPSLQLAHAGECTQSAGPNCGDIMCTAYYDPLCGSDGTTYSNLCTLQADQCDKPSLQVAYKGECTQSAGPGPCGDIMCTEDYDPQCGSDGTTYSNLCTLQASQCDKPSLQVAYKGECTQSAGCGDIMCTADYDPQCGSDGTTYSNLCTFQASQCDKPSLQAAYKGECTRSASGDKPGDCPPIDEDNILCVKQINPCQSDQDCTGIEKCCWTGCSPLCMEPSDSKPGYCPAVTVDQVGACVQECNTDGDCSGTEKCCKNGCGSTCQRARTSKPGECPPINEEEIICVNQINPCETDMDCDGVEKCCWTGCSPVCEKPIPREGFCLDEADVSDSCERPSCEEDYDCEPPQKCCSACGAKKCFPVEAPKPGICPAVEEGMMGICMEGCAKDSDCQGGEKCCSNGCGHACKLPANNTCEVMGKEYLPGPVPDPDGCNECVCSEDGRGVACTEMACSCEIRGETYFMGQWYDVGEDGCNQCKCRGNNDDLGSECTDYYCGGDHERMRGGYMKTFALVSVCIGVFFIILAVSVLFFVYYKHKKNTSKSSAKVANTSKAQLTEDAEPLPVKA